MESALKQLRNNKPTVETVINGYPITMRFDPEGNEHILSSVKTTLATGYVDATLNKSRKEKLSTNSNHINTNKSLNNPEQKPSVLNEIRDARLSKNPHELSTRSHRASEKGVAY